MKQPTKDVLREQLALAADEIIRQREIAEAAARVVEAARSLLDELDAQPRRWWHRFAWWRA